MRSRPPKHQLSQNFLHDSRLVNTLVERMAIGPDECVVEIGPGRGIITHELLQRAAVVVAIERDIDLATKLREKFKQHKNFVLIAGDFVESQLPLSRYRVVANTAFEIAGVVIKKLLDSPHPPTRCDLVLRRAAAYRWAGLRRSTARSIIRSPWWEYALLHEFNGGDFQPPTRVRTVLMSFTARTTPLLQRAARHQFEQYVLQMFANSPKNKLQQLRSRSIAGWVEAFRSRNRS